MFSIRRLLPILGFVLCVTPCWATWALVSAATPKSCSSGSSCAVTVASTGTGHLMVTRAAFASTTVTISSASGAGTWVHPTGCHGSDSAGGGGDWAYNLSTTSGVTSITVNFSASDSNPVIWIWEFSGTSPAYDVCNTIDDSSTCTSCIGASLSLNHAGSNYILFAGSSCGGTCSAIDQSYVATFANGDGGAYKLNQTSFGTTPHWTSTSSTLGASALGIYENTGGATCALSIALMGVGCR